MKLEVQGVEEIEITDPAGLCTPSVPQGLRAKPQSPQGMAPPFFPNPLGPTTPINPPTIYTKNILPGQSVTPGPDPSKWEVGGNSIQKAGQDINEGLTKWEKNWNSSLGGKAPDGD